LTRHRDAEVRAEHDPGAAFDQVDRRQRRGDARVVVIFAGLLVERDVEVDAHEHALALDGSSSTC
jgi:hypothetical protein